MSADYTKLSIYVAGPMQGYPEFNFPRFNAVAHHYRARGHHVFNPAEKDIEHHGTDISKGNKTGSIAEAAAKHGFSLRRALKDDTTFICDEATAIVMLPGWELSNGARAEHALAVALQRDPKPVQIIYLSPDQCRAMEQVHQEQRRGA